MNAFQAALDHAVLMVPTFPLNGDKTPRTPRGFKDACLEHDPVEWAGAELVGLPTGAASGWTVLDIDPRHGGDIWLAEHEHHLPPTRRVATRSGGSHLYFAAVAGIRCSAGRIAPGVDIRSDGGYVVDWSAAGFPVQHADTTAEMPGWLVRAAAGPRVHASGADRPELDPPPSVDAVVALLDRLPNPDNATRDTYIAVMLAARGCIDALPDGESDIAEAACGWACRWSGSPGFDAESEKWESDFAHRDAQLSGWPHLLAAARRLGLDTTAEQSAGSLLTAMPDAPAPAARGKRMRDRLLRPADCATMPGRGYVVKGMIAPGDVGAVIGQPGCGKSTLAPFLAYAVAQGRPVFGCRTKPGAVLYVAAEDCSGMRQRIHALSLQHGDAPNLALVDCGNLADAAASADLLDAVSFVNPALVILDTVGAAFAGMDENDAAGMGAVVALARRIAGSGAAVLLIHHTAKQSDGTPRGHSVLNGTLDMSLSLGAMDESRIVRGKLVKNRNGSCGLDIAFRSIAVTLGTDEDGDDITAPTAAELAGNVPPQRAKLSPREQRALDILIACDTNGTGINEQAWHDGCEDQALVASDMPSNRRKAAAVTMRALIGKGAVLTGGGLFKPRNRPEQAGTAEQEPIAATFQTTDDWPT
jgi:hypothetical protein